MSPKGANSSAKAPGMKWQDCRSTVFDPQVLATALLKGDLVRYCAPAAVAGRYQGDALIVLGRSGLATKAGAWIERVHLAASDSGYVTSSATRPPLARVCSSTTSARDHRVGLPAGKQQRPPTSRGTGV